ncbi:MAG: CPBP family intramembrane metalloprotease [Phycisphaerales bacterium]|nr:MAG: CPBP family intramembrane metalloprotease [Phycisphaerales bacterium]
MIDRKGILWFLLVTFGITFVYEGALILSGLNMNFAGPFAKESTAPYLPLLIGMAMWIPAMSTVIVVKFITKEGFAITNLRIGPIRPYVVSALTVPACFAVIYGLTWLAGLAQPDWRFEHFRSSMEGMGIDTSAMPPVFILAPMIFVSSLIVGPFVNGIFGFGEELGWRGYLMPKLLALGRPKAYVILGVIWGLWHAPLIVAGFNYPGYPLLGIIVMCGMTTAFGIYINEMTLRNRSSILAGWIHGAFNGQAYGIWRILFPDANPLLGGFTGLAGIAVWGVVGCWMARRHTRTSGPRT